MAGSLKVRTLVDMGVEGWFMGGSRYVDLANR